MASVKTVLSRAQSRASGGRWSCALTTARALRYACETMRRLAGTLLFSLVALLLLAPTALATVDGGQGLYGQANDKVVTNAGFILIAFVPLFIATMSFIQWRL